MFKILILFCLVLTVKLLTSHRRMAKFKRFYENLMDKQGKETFLDKPLIKRLTQEIFDVNVFSWTRLAIKVI